MTIAAANAQPLTMINSASQSLATPSSLGVDGASFTVTRTNVAAAVQPAAPSINSGARSTGRWSRTGTGVQGYTAPARTIRTNTGFGRFSFNNFTVFFRSFKNNIRDGWNR